MKELFTGTTLNGFLEAARVQPLIPEEKEEERAWDSDMLRDWALKRGYREKRMKDYAGWFKYVGFVFEDEKNSILAVLRHKELHTAKWNYYFHHDQYGTEWSELYDSSADAIAGLITTFHIRSSQWGQVQATVDKLTPVQKRIMKYLWARPSVNMQDVNRSDIEALTKLGLVKKLTVYTFGATEIGKRVGLWVEPEQYMEQKGIPTKPPEDKYVPGPKEQAAGIEAEIDAEESRIEEKMAQALTNWVVEVRTKRGKKHIYSYGVGSQAEAEAAAKKDASRIYFENGESRREVVVKSPPHSKVPDKVITFG